jgi:hypothetical protein
LTKTEQFPARYLPDGLFSRKENAMCRLALIVSVRLIPVQILDHPRQLAPVQFPDRFSQIAAQGISTTTIRSTAAENISANN